MENQTKQKNINVDECTDLQLAELVSNIAELIRQKIEELSINQRSYDVIVYEINKRKKESGTPSLFEEANVINEQKA